MITFQDASKKAGMLSIPIQSVTMSTIGMGRIIPLLPDQSKTCTNTKRTDGMLPSVLLTPAVGIEPTT